MKKGRGPRSNFSLLPFPLRFKLIQLLHDGATFEAIQKESDIREGYARLGISLTRSALSRIKQSKEYREITALRLKAIQAHEADRITSALIHEQDLTGTIGEQAALELMNSIRSNIALAEDTREVERLVRCAVALTNSARDRENDRLKSEIERLKEENAALTRRIADLQEDGAARTQGGLSEEALAKAEEKIKIM